jgi:GNAT superfamily N-acetyltransferase
VPSDAVRRAGPDDWELVKELRLAALADSPTAFGSTLERERAFPDDEWRRRVGDGHWWVASAGPGGGVGLVAAVPEAGAPRDRHLVAMWVHPDHRGGPAATALVEAVCAWAGLDGADAVTLWVVDDNHRARRFYERLGFAPTGIRQSLPRDDTVSERQLRRPVGPGPA